MNIGEIGKNLLIGIISGIISGIIVTRVFMLIQEYLDEFRQIRTVALKIYRLDIYLRVIISQAQKYVSYENNPNDAIINIADFNKEVIFINSIYEQIREESLFSKYNYNNLEQYRNELKDTFEHPINDILTYNVAQLVNLNNITSNLYNEYEKENKRKRKEIRNIIIEDQIIRIMVFGAIAVSLILIA